MENVYPSALYAKMILLNAHSFLPSAYVLHVRCPYLLETHETIQERISGHMYGAILGTMRRRRKQTQYFFSILYLCMQFLRVINFFFHPVRAI